MKVISLKEPYASLIVNGTKRIETRSWKTNYRGKLYIHASASKISKDILSRKELMELVDIDNLYYGKIVCSCDLVDCILMTDEFISSVKKNRGEYLSGEYAVGRYAWILENIQILDEMIPAKGQLGIWNFDMEK